MRSLLALFLICLFPLYSFSSKDAWDDDRSQWSPLMNAIYKENNKKVERLLTKGVSINFFAVSNKTRFAITPLEVAIRKNNSEAFLLLCGFDSIEYVTDYLWLASAYESTAIMEEILSKGANPNDTSIESPLIRATISSTLEMMKVLLEHGADIQRYREIDGNNALFYAAGQKNLEKVKLLLDYGADTSDKNSNNQRAYDWLFFNTPSNEISEEDLTELKNLLL